MPANMNEKPAQEPESPVIENEDEELTAPSFSEIKDDAKEEVVEVAGRVKNAGLTPFRRVVDDVVGKGLDVLDTLADVWAGKRSKK